MKWETEAVKSGKTEDIYPLVSHVECDVIRPMILGRIGERYYGREVVVFKLNPHIWGSPCKERNSRLLTLHNGILNQCKLENPPTVYWTILDIASDLKEGFNGRELVKRAVLLVGEDKRRSCYMAYCVLRNHHRHARKKNSCMSHMIDSLPNNRLIIRGRGADETMAYFDSIKSREADAAKVMAEVAEFDNIARYSSGDDIGEGEF